MKIQVEASLAGVDAAAWDGANLPYNAFHSHRFLESVEKSRPENCDLWFVLFWEDSRLVATAVLSAFSVDLGLFVGGHRLVRAVRRVFPGFLHVRTLFCGLPVSTGTKNLAVHPDFSGQVLTELAGLMEGLGRAEKIVYLCVKEVREHECRGLEALGRMGFFRANSLPYMTLPIRWPNFEAYLAACRHPYRRKIRLSLRKLGLMQPEIQDYSPEWAATRRTGLAVGGAEVCPPSLFHRLYLPVMDRAAAKLETLNPAFFEAFFTSMHESLRLLAFFEKGEVTCVALLLVESGEMTFVFAGKRDEKNTDADPYFNLMAGMVALAIRLGCTRLKLGQAAYALKQRLGAEAEDEFLFFKARSRPLHWLLRLFRDSLFPKCVLPAVRVFR